MPDSSAAPSMSPSPTFREYLWPAWWIWIVVLGTGGAGYVMFAPISTGAGLTAGVIVTLLLVVVLINHTMTSGRIEVDEEWVRVGRARIERRYIGEKAAFRGEAAHAARGRDLNGTAYMCFRGWIDPVVTLEVTDPEDATPYWITSTRRPDELLAALNSDAQNTPQQ